MYHIPSKNLEGSNDMTYLDSMIKNLECNLILLREQLSSLEHYPELTGTVISKYVRCSRPNCACCAAGYYHGPNLYYRYFENGELKDKYLGKKIKEEYIHKTEANKKYNALAKEIRDAEAELEHLRRLERGEME